MGADGAVAMASQEADAEGEEKKEEEPKTEAPKREKLAPRQFLKIDEQESDDEDAERKKTVFEELCRVFLGILKNG